VIEIEDSPVNPSTQGPQAIQPAKRRGLATYIPSMPDFKLGHAETERQYADQRQQDRKSKSGFTTSIPIIHFSIGVAHFCWDEFNVEDGGLWIAVNHQWSVD
jgi:hypothetical protein